MGSHGCHDSVPSRWLAMEMCCLTAPDARSPNQGVGGSEPLPKALVENPFCPSQPPIAGVPGAPWPVGASLQSRPLSSRGFTPVCPCPHFPLLLRTPVTMHLELALKQYDLISTNYICQDTSSRKGPILRFQVDMNGGVGGGEPHCSTWYMIPNGK